MDENRGREEGLFNAISFYGANQVQDLKKFYYQRKRFRLGSVLVHLAQNWELLGLKAYFVDQNVYQMKQDFYLACKLRIFSIGQDGGEKLETGSVIVHALLTDNCELIKRVVSDEMQELLSGRHNPLLEDFKIHMWQLAICGNDTELTEKIGKLERNGRKIDRTEAVSRQDFFSLLVKKDKAALEKIIQGHARFKGNGTVLEDFMSYQATFEAKLCWYRGIDVQIDNPSVPMELMPIRPLNTYDEYYDFLAPGWIPPRQGRLADFSRWVKKTIKK